MISDRLYVPSEKELSINRMYAKEECHKKN